MNHKRKLHLLNEIKKLTYIPLFLSPFFYFSLRRIGLFKSWYLLALISVSIGFILSHIVVNIIEKKVPGISKLKNDKGFKLIHYTNIIGVLFMFSLITISNLYLNINSEISEYPVYSTGEKGGPFATDTKKVPYINIIHDDGSIEQLELGVKILLYKKDDSVKLLKETSFMGFVHHQVYYEK